MHSEKFGRDVVNDLRPAIAIWQAGVNSVVGEVATGNALAATQARSWQRILAIGKAACSMTLGAIDSLPPNGNALVVTKYNHTDSALACDHRVRIIESAHPVPDQRSLDAGRAVSDFVATVAKSDSLLVLVSGGASALVELPLPGVDLETLQTLSKMLLADGYSIDQINAIRIQISRIKGGKLLRQFSGKRICVYALSDIPGDAADLIGSGIGAIAAPMLPAFQIPAAIQRIIDQATVSPKTTPTQALAFEFESRLIGTNRSARDAAEQAAVRMRLSVVESVEIIDGDILRLAKRLAQRLIDGASGVYIWGGESTVNLPANPGLGGRNQSLALALALALSAATGLRYSAVVAGTDGTDGVTDSAGGLIHSGLGLAGAAASLQQADASTWLQQSDALFVTGPTATNVMDLVVVIKQ